MSGPTRPPRVLVRVSDATAVRLEHRSGLMLQAEKSDARYSVITMCLPFVDSESCGVAAAVLLVSDACSNRIDAWCR
jgi:hypothetical protein